MDTSAYSPSDKKILKDYPNATLEELKELGMSKAGAQRYASDKDVEANAPVIDSSKVEVTPEPTAEGQAAPQAPEAPVMAEDDSDLMEARNAANQPTVTDSTVTTAANVATEGAMQPTLSQAPAAVPQTPAELPVNTFSQVVLDGPGGRVEVSPQAARILIQQGDFTLVSDNG